MVDPMVEVDPMVDPMVEVYMSSKMALKIKSEVYLYTPHEPHEPHDPMVEVYG